VTFENRTGDATLEHVANFVECLRSRKKPNADVELGHRASLAAHLGNLAYLRRARLGFDVGRERVVVESPSGV
jgi:hypothetical protein